jgi:hypothetical protein
LASLQAASCTYRIALGPRTGQKVLSLRTVAGRAEKITAALCADAHEFSLHAGVRCGAHQRKELRYIPPAIANEGQLWRKSTVRNGSIAPIRFLDQLTFDQLFMLVGVLHLWQSALEIARHALRHRATSAAP